MDDTHATGSGGRGASVVIFGEVLYDCFPGGRRVLGGAPFNVAWHLRGLGGDPLFVSAVGRDADGDAIRAAMGDWNLDTAGLRTVPDLATGTVAVTLDDGEPSYEISAPRAWDAIADDGLCATRLLYHGSLALRDKRSRTTFEALRARSEGIRFLDLNLRPPHYDIGAVRDLARGAEWLKLNLDELAQVAGLGELAFSEAGAVMEEVRERYAVGNLLLTAGEEGAWLSGTRGGARVSPAPAPPALVDPVGAGDSFSAVAILGILRGWDGRRLLETASAFAAKVCGLRGATTYDKEFYRGIHHE